ncbi:hypothetical protein TetV_210 [Tetraselmis virus 1]|uniref:RING-type domain-containing protein n=1 Tax=Tetraselmis virus 1 TaxID=2060617 RepID=A0A2P0VN15_9VIRU|nr:hypothetical protein QJ968_gp210 [Tetraselmis virus 1]AUF82302.1 hypothetical protein TetV_210 [Tetraselmis virus 1]
MIIIDFEELFTAAEIVLIFLISHIMITDCAPNHVWTLFVILYVCIIADIWISFKKIRNNKKKNLVQEEEEKEDTLIPGQEFCMVCLVKAGTKYTCNGDSKCWNWLCQDCISNRIEHNQCMICRKKEIQYIDVITKALKDVKEMKEIFTKERKVYSDQYPFNENSVDNLVKAQITFLDNMISKLDSATNDNARLYMQHTLQYNNSHVLMLQHIKGMYLSKSNDTENLLRLIDIMIRQAIHRNSLYKEYIAEPFSNAS